MERSLFKINSVIFDHDGRDNYIKEVKSIRINLNKIVTIEPINFKFNLLMSKNAIAENSSVINEATKYFQIAVADRDYSSTYIFITEKDYDRILEVVGYTEEGE